MEYIGIDEIWKKRRSYDLSLREYNDFEFPAAHMGYH